MGGDLQVLVYFAIANLVLAIFLRLKWEWDLLSKGDSQFWYLAGIQASRTISDRIFGNITIVLGESKRRMGIDDMNLVHKIMAISDRTFPKSRARFNPPKECVTFNNDTRESVDGPGSMQKVMSISVSNRGVWAVQPWLIQRYSSRIGKLQQEAFLSGFIDAGQNTSKSSSLLILLHFWVDVIKEFCKSVFSRKSLVEYYYILGMLAMHEGSIQGYDGNKATFRIQTNKIDAWRVGPLDGKSNRTNHYGKRNCGDPQTSPSANSGCGVDYCVEEHFCPSCNRPNELNQDYVAMCVPYFMDVCRRAQLLFRTGMRFQKLRVHDGMKGRRAVSLSTPQIIPNRRVRRLLGIGRNQPVNQTTLEKPPEHLLSMANGEYLLESLPSNEIAEEVLRGVYDSAGLIPALSAKSNTDIHRMQLESDNGTWYWQVPICLMAQDVCNTPMDTIDWPVVGVKIPITHDEIVKERKDTPTKWRGHNQQTKAEMASFSSNIGTRNPVYSMAAKETLKTFLDKKTGEPKSSKKCPEKRFAPFKNFRNHKEIVRDSDFTRDVEIVQNTLGSSITELIPYTLKNGKPGFKKIAPKSGSITLDVWPEVTTHHPEEIRGKVFGEFQGVCKSMGCPHMGSCSIYPERRTA